MKTQQESKKQEAEAIDEIKKLESTVGVNVKSGLRAGAGGGNGKGGIYQPLYGAPTSTI